MSAYITFYVKSRENDFLPIACFCRSNVYYEFGYDHVPHDDVCKPLTKQVISNILADIREAKQKEEDYLIELKNKISTIAGMNNTVEEKMDYINDYDESISYTKERIEELNDCYMFYCTMGYIIEEAEGTTYYSDKSRHLNPDDYLYAGVECRLPNGQDEE